jgi:hypothetical protein
MGYIRCCFTLLEVDSVKNEGIIYMGRVSAWGAWLAFFALVTVFVSAMHYHEIPESLAPMTFPTLSEATNTEPARSILVASLMLAIPLLLLGTFLFYIKMIQLLSYETLSCKVPGKEETTEQQDQRWFHEKVLRLGRQLGTLKLWFSVIPLLLISCGAQLPLETYKYTHCVLVSLGFTGLVIWCFISHRALTHTIPNILTYSGLRGDATIYPSSDSVFSSRVGCTDVVGYNLCDTLKMRRLRELLLSLLTALLLGTIVFGVLSFVFDKGTVAHDNCTFFALPLCEYGLFLVVILYVFVLVRAYQNTVLRLEWPVGYPTAKDLYITNGYHKSQAKQRGVDRTQRGAMW